jgi:hypothetical protein
MKRIAYLTLLAAASSGCASAATRAECPIAGDMIHWRADYCLFETGTDDIIAAGPCMERETRKLFRSSCTGNFYYKRAMCELAIGTGQRHDSADHCVKDPLFVGPTVRNGGA